MIIVGRAGFFLLVFLQAGVLRVETVVCSV